MESLFSRRQAVKFSLQTVIPKTTPSSTLIFSISLLVLSAFNYGFSDQAFATTQAMNSFIKEFGEHNVNTNTYAIPALFTSLYNSLKVGGQIVGYYHLLFISPTSTNTNSAYLFSAVHRYICWKLGQQSLWTPVVYFLDEYLRPGYLVHSHVFTFRCSDLGWTLAALSVVLHSTCYTT
jgi:hypothetical protein